MLDIQTFKREYGILCRRAYPRPETFTPFGATWCVVEPGGTTLPHGHHEGETFFIVDGKGEMRIGLEKSSVARGDVVYIPANAPHVLVNESSAEPLVFVSVWWDGEAPASPPRQSFITVAPPTPNGGLHLGHLSGPYVASDVYRRYLGLHGADTYFVTGSDDNQSYVPVKAARLGWSPRTTADIYTASIQSTLAAARVEPDYYLRPLHTPEYIAFVGEFFKKLVDTGKIVLREAPSLFCETCERHLFEAHVRGGCPHCGAGTNGHGCEACGVTNDAVDLKDPKCNHCDAVPAVRTSSKFYFPLSEYRGRLEAYYRTAAMNSRLGAFTAALVRDGLPDISATFISEWGVPVPLPGYSDQVIYEWLEMAAGYLFMARKLRAERNWDPFRKSAGREIVQFFGFDNSFFYTAFLPALFMAFDEESALPRAFVTNEFYRLEGLKFSTSRNHAIWGEEFLKTVPADTARFYLAMSRPETEQTNFTMSDFEATVQRELIEGVDAWLESLDGGFGTPVDDKAHAKLRALVSEMDSHYRAETFSLNEAARTLMAIVRLGKRSGLGLTALKAFAITGSPLMPGVCGRILQALGESARWDAEAAPFPIGRRIGKLPVGELSQRRNK